MSFVIGEMEREQFGESEKTYTAHVVWLIETSARGLVFTSLDDVKATKIYKYNLAMHQAK